MLRYLRIGWDVGLVVCSFSAFRATRFVLRSLMYIHSWAGRHRHLHAWQVMSSEFIGQPGILPVVMTEGPRWNPHAISASVGPVAVKETLSIDLAVAARSAKSWTFVVYSFPRQHVVAHLGPPDFSPSASVARLTLPSGNCTIVARYYHWSDDVQLPAINADGREAVAAQSVDSNNNQFFAELPRRSNLVYQLLHGHVGVLLRWQHFFPQRWIRQMMVPMGNPDTEFFFGAIGAGQSALVECPACLLHDHDIYMTIYNNASFPTLWYEIDEPKHVGTPAPASGFFLLRVRRRSPSDDLTAEETVQVTVLPRSSLPVVPRA